MNKIKVLFITLVMVITFNFNASALICADTNEDTVVEEGQKEEVLNLIKDYLDAIDKKIINIDAMVENSRKQDEFDYYPAIRLDIDTPLFGLLSLTENKLIVKSDISTSDIANKYSIRDIVRKNKIRLPDSYLGAIVVSTKEYDIDDTMTLPQARITLVKCIQYLSQVESAEKYTQNKINRTYKDYINEDKKTSLREIKERCTRLEQNLVTISDKILISAFIGVDMSEYTKRYIEIAANINNIKESAKNSLILQDELSELTKSSNMAETNIIDLSTDVDKIYQKALYDMEYGKFITNVHTNIKARYEFMEKYIKESKKESVIDSEEKIVSEETIYSVTSLSTRDYLNVVVQNLENEIENLEEKIEEESTEEKVELTEEEIEAKRQEKIKENEEKIKAIYETYKDVVNREYNFYTNNINMLLKDSNSKISSIINEIDDGIDVDKSVFDYVKYIYLDLPTNLTKYIDNNNLKSTLELNNLVGSLKTELNNLANTNYNLSKIYSKILDYLKNS